MSLSPMHCLDLSHWTQEDYLFFFTQVETLKEKGFDAVAPHAKGQSFGLIFQEPSTRTRVSFEKAVHHLGGTSYVLADQSSMLKGETLLDTLETLTAMGIEHFIIRTDETDLSEIACVFADQIIINAGAGPQAHPTQGLLDAYTVWEHHQQLQTLNVVLVGDLVHSRVARSNLTWMKAFGLTPTLVGPSAWIKGFDAFDVVIEEDMHKAISNADVVMLHRVQKERMAQDEAFDAPSFFDAYGFGGSEQDRLKDDAIVMHPGPVNRGIEIAPEIVSGPSSKILTQVHNGVWTRIALTSMLLEKRGA